MDNYIKIPISVVKDKNISSSAKILYGIVVVLSLSKNYSFASNKYLSEFLNVDIRTITRLLRELKNNNYITITKEGYHRKIYINEMKNSSILLDNFV